MAPAGISVAVLAEALPGPAAMTSSTSKYLRTPPARGESAAHVWVGVVIGHIGMLHVAACSSIGSPCATFTSVTQSVASSLEPASFW